MVTYIRKDIFFFNSPNKLTNVNLHIALRKDLKILLKVIYDTPPCLPAQFVSSWRNQSMVYKK